MGIRTCDLLPCSTVPRRTALPRMASVVASSGSQLVQLFLLLAHLFAKTHTRRKCDIPGENQKLVCERPPVRHKQTYTRMLKWKSRFSLDSPLSNEVLAVSNFGHDNKCCSPTKQQMFVAENETLFICSLNTQRKHSNYCLKSRVALCCENHTVHTDTLRGQNAGF
jgi:hypothetical protein